jgi:pimeloyl-ACP methyl ester carboxylesterase
MQCKIAGAEITYHVAGEGPAVLFLHGFPLGLWTWDAQAEALKARYRVVRFDDRGFGASPPGDGPLTMERIADDAAGLLDHLGIERACVAGCSMGGYAAFAMVRRHPDRLRGLVLQDTRAGADSEEARKNRALLAEKTLSDNQRQVDVGTLARIDLIQSQTQVATRREERIVSTFTQNQVQDQIKKVLSREQDAGLILARISPTQRAGLPDPSDILPIADAIRVALENRPELRQASLQLRNSEIEMEYAKNQLLPTLDIIGRFVHSGVGGTQTIRDGFGPNAPIIAVIPGGLVDAFGNLARMQSRGFSGGFNMQIPLSNRSQQAEYSRVTTQKRTVEENIKATEAQIALEVRNSITAVEMNKARIETARVSRELQQQQYDAEQRRFELGASTVRFVLDEQDNLERLQTNEIAALVNYRKALVDYDHALGITLKKNNVSIDKALAALK